MVDTEKGNITIDDGGTPQVRGYSAGTEDGLYELDQSGIDINRIFIFPDEENKSAQQTIS